MAPADYFSSEGESGDGGAPPDDSGPPIEELESRMAAEVAAQASSAASSAARKRGAASDDDDATASKAPLPELDALLERLAPEVRETLDELFRVRFVSVKKVAKSAFAPATTRKSGA